MSSVEPFQNEVRQKLVELRLEHRDLDSSIQALIETGRADMLQLQRMKKKKLQLKDHIKQLEAQLRPDIIA
ncbi:MULTISPECIES: YdcH family protein [Pseudovibrio]|uniref:YdcH family protein n=1 Tax=Stappiaceae TaxID=2821832 RepID=UPI00236730AF|nr:MULTISPECIES: DUF465 domain-containing protein [Pseudovibrio]MDD7911882.1 DUF465 domain-containing protein [Pseudovibrio exalbescens]MDX5595452.1 DUF465 domain-containing protein [Pseudovibrio sp. SPO723]